MHGSQGSLSHACAPTHAWPCDMRSTGALCMRAHSPTAHASCRQPSDSAGPAWLQAQPSGRRLLQAAVRQGSAQPGAPPLAPGSVIPLSTSEPAAAIASPSDPTAALSTPAAAAPQQDRSPAAPRAATPDGAQVVPEPRGPAVGARSNDTWKVPLIAAASAAGALVRTSHTPRAHDPSSLPLLRMVPSRCTQWQPTPEHSF